MSPVWLAVVLVGVATVALKAAGPVLLGGRGHLHTPRPPNARVGNVTVASDLVRGIHDNDAFAYVICQQARRFAQQGGLSDPRAPEEEQGLPLFDNIAQNVHSAKQRPPDPTG